MYKKDEYIKYTGNEIPFSERHDGMLRHVVGAHHIQILRANRRHPEYAEGFGNTYNHAPNIIYWNNKFYCHWLSNPVSEHIGLSQTYISTSDNGLNWSRPAVLFPPYPLDLSVDNGPQQDLLEEGNAYACMHQRMGFYIAHDRRLLALGYYGLSAEVAILPCVGKGIGRVVREIYTNGEFGPIYFLLLNKTCGYNENNVLYPMFTSSGDENFVKACQALLEDKLIMQQMWEENRDCEDNLFPMRGAGEAFNHYCIKDDTIIGLWKHSRVSKSSDNGKTWLPVQKCPSLVMSGGKIWGQSTSDGRYALAYNPVTDSCHRWPLAVVTSDDGIEFQKMLCAMGEVPPQRYWGFWRDYGPQYIRGMECEAQPSDGAMWLTYSMNKEDIWVSCLPVPIRDAVTEHISDDFSDMMPQGIIRDWNIYSPKWAEVSLEKHPVKDNPNKNALRMRCREPYDYAKASRIFPESERVLINMQLEARQNYFGRLEIDVADKRGLAVFRIIFDSDRTIKLKYGNGFMPVAFYGYGITEIDLTLDCYQKTAGITINPNSENRAHFEGLRFFGCANTVERIEFRTGAVRHTPLYDHDVEFQTPADLPNSDEPLAQEPVYYIHSLSTKALD